MATKKLLKRPRPKFTVGLISTPGTMLNKITNPGITCMIRKLIFNKISCWWSFYRNFYRITVLNYQTNIHTSRFLFPIFSSQFKFFKLTSVSNYTRYAPNLHITHLRKKIWLTKKFQPPVTIRMDGNFVGIYSWAFQFPTIFFLVIVSYEFGDSTLLFIRRTILN